MTSTNLVKIEQHLTDSVAEIQAAAIGRMVDPDRLVRIVLSVAEAKGDSGEKLRKCTPDSFLLACLNAAAIGLEPTGLLGDAYLVPYGTTCTLQIGYKGLIKLMKRTGEIVRLESHEVYDCDHFAYRYGTDPVIEHEPGAADKRGSMVYAYAIAWFKSGHTQFEVMSPAEIAAVRAKSKGADRAGSPWKTFEAMMWRKTVLRRLSNYLELSASDRAAIAYDDAVTVSGEAIDVRDLDPESFTDANEKSRVASDVKLEQMGEKLEDEKAKTKVRKQIGGLLQGVGLSTKHVGDFAQTTFGHLQDLIDDDGRVMTDELSLEDLEALRKAVGMGVVALTEGQSVIVDSFDEPGETLTLEPEAVS